MDEQLQNTNPQPEAAPEHSEGGPSESEAKKGGRFTSEIVEFIWETAKVVIISLVIILPIRYYLIQPFFVKGQSMFPTYHDKEYILVDKWTYRIDKPERGDILLFRAPPNPKEYYIKRIIALPGERITIKNNVVHIYNDEFPNGFVLNEKQYLPESHMTEGTIDRTLEEDEFFAMGDNRQHSSDSRAFGPVPRDMFSGVAWLRLWPLTRIEFIDRTTYPPVIE